QLSLIFCYQSLALSTLSTLSLHDALPICLAPGPGEAHHPSGMTSLWPREGLPMSTCRYRTPQSSRRQYLFLGLQLQSRGVDRVQDRKSTRLNSSHLVISYAVFCLKKKILL